MHRLVIGTVGLLGVAAVAVVAGYLFLFSAAVDRAAALAPANTAFYVNVYLQPSTGQQMNLSELIGRLPGFADDASLDEKVDQVVQNLLSGTGIDYREQVKPWLGDQVALAGWPGEDGVTEAEPVVIAEVKDPDAARVAVADLVASGGSLEAETYEGIEIQVSTSGAYAFVGEMLVIGPDAAVIRPVIDAHGGAESLADRAEFRQTMDALEPDHLAAIFLDLAAVGEASGTSEQLAAVSTAGAVLVAERDGLRLSGSAPYDRGQADPSAQAGFALGGEPSSLVDWMPDDTIAEIVVFGLRQTLEDAEAAVGQLPEGEELGSMLDTVRTLAAFGLGINLDDDVLPLFDREVALAISGIDGELPTGQLLLRPSDPEAAESTLDRLADGLSAIGATRETVSSGSVEVTIVSLPDTGEVAYTVVDGIVILGLRAEDVAAAVESHAAGASLGSSERYTRTFEVAGTRAGNEGFVDVGAVVDLLGGGVDVPDDARDILEQVGTFGFTAPSRDDSFEFHAVLTIDPAPE
jgi:hypothetical protein